MTQTPGLKKQVKAAGAVAPAFDDLSRLIEQSVEKSKNEQVKAVHLFSSFYRCNWWVIDPDPNSLFVRTGRISRSRFVRAVRTETGIQIDEVAPR